MANNNSLFNPRSVKDPNGYGNGVRYYNGGDSNLTILYGADHVADALLCRLSCSPLWYVNDGSYGYNLLNLLNFTTSQTAHQVAARAKQEILKDDRVATCDVVGTGDLTTGVYTMSFTIKLQPGGETFTLVGNSIGSLSVSQLPFA